MTTLTKRDAVSAAMAVAEDVACGKLDPADLERHRRRRTTSASRHRDGTGRSVVVASGRVRAAGTRGGRGTGRRTR